MLTHISVALTLLLCLAVGSMTLAEGDGQLSKCVDYLVYGHQGPPETELFQTSCDSEILDECCEQLGAVKQECRCDIIKLKLLKEEKHIESYKLMGVVRRDRNLPAMCCLEPHRCGFPVNFSAAYTKASLSI